MNSVNCVEQQALMTRKEASRQHDESGRLAPLAPREAQQIEVLLVLDARGRIQYSGGGISCLQPTQQIPDRPINTLIPSLPLRETTPGYNIAYVRYAFADSVWQQHLLSTETRLIPVEIHLRTIQVAAGFCLLGLLRFAIQGTQDTWETSSRHEHPEYLPEWHIKQELMPAITHCSLSS